LVRHTPGPDRWWFYERSIAVEEMSNVVESAAEAMGAPPTIIILDYLGLLAGKGKLYERTSDNARALKEAAKETNTIILTCAQISRQVGGSGEEEPTLAGMRDSGAIEEAADRALLFWGVPNSSDEIMCRIAKNRYGNKSEKVALRFDDAMRLREYTDMYETGVPF
jgi:replicative DNA helicase